MAAFIDYNESSFSVVRGGNRLFFVQGGCGMSDINMSKSVVDEEGLAAYLASLPDDVFLNLMVEIGFTEDPDAEQKENQ